MEKQSLNRTIQKYFIYTIGVMILGAGVALCNASTFGTDSLSVFVNAVSKRSGLTMGIVNGAVCVFQIVVGYILDKRTVTLASFISIFASSIGIDLMAFFLPSNPSVFLRVGLMILGLLVYAFGTALSQLPNCGYNTYDCLIFGLAHAFHVKEYAHIRWCVDGSFLVVGFLLGGTVGICTVLVFLLVGKLVEYYLKRLQKKIKIA